MTQVYDDYRGLVQLRLASAADLENIHALDPARWSATSVPVEQLLCDKGFLAFVDTDGDGRIRVQDVLAAHRWVKERLVDMARLTEGSDTVRVADLAPGAQQLKQLITARLGAGDSVTLAQIRAFAESYKKKQPNGDGVVVPSQIDDVDVRSLAAAIVAFGGAPADLSGELGVDTKTLDAFIEHAKATVAWESERSWDPALDDAAAAVHALAPQLERFFLLCDLLAQERSAGEVVDGPATALDVGDLVAVRTRLERAPIQRPTPAGILDAAAHLNPVYAAAVAHALEVSLPLVLSSAKPITRMNRAQWEKAQQIIAPVIAHREKKPRDLGFSVDVVLTGASVALLRGMIDEDQRASHELTGLADLERLALYQKWLLPLCNNMVSFPALFRVNERCLFEAGTLILDGRVLSFCVIVVDRAANKALATRANLFVVYMEITRKDGTTTEKREIAAAVTSGTRGSIRTGKRGVFYDREGREHDAVVLDIIENPISLWEAATAPFRRFAQFVEDRIEKLASSSLASLEKRPLPALVEEKPAAAPPAQPLVVVNNTPAPPAPPPASPASGMSGLALGAGVAVAALGSAAAFALQTLTNIAPLRFAIAILGLVLAVAFLAGFLGWLKLRRRDLSILLEACGWAFNVQILLTRRHSLRFTRVPPLPKDSVRRRVRLPVLAAGDEDRSGWTVLVFIIIGALVALAVVLREPIAAFFTR